MREIVAVCRSTKKARADACRILDRYFWRIGDSTWRGKASNQCLDRVASDLRAKASRAMAVTIYEIRSSRESRRPLIRIGSSKRFSESGLVPVSVAQRRAPRSVDLPPMLAAHRTAIRIAALFHDLGKATRLFQAKIHAALAGRETSADAVRHEVVSALVWDELTRGVAHAELPDTLSSLCATKLKEAFERAGVRAHTLISAASDHKPFDFAFESDLESTAGVIGALILCHHRLPDTGLGFSRFLSCEHINPHVRASLDDFAIAPGEPPWNADWLAKLHREAEALRSAPEKIVNFDQFARTAVMLADHVGSAEKKSGNGSGILANTTRSDASGKQGKAIPADDLGTHTKRVYDACRGAFHATYLARHGYPSLAPSDMPIDVLTPPALVPGRFRWQAEAAASAALVAGSEGGFFACLLAGTGTGKTRAAPTILSAATFSDANEARRGFRFTLALGLRSLASQSAKEYTHSLGFSARDIAVLIGTAPLEFRDAEKEGSEDRFENLVGVHVGSVDDFAPPEGEDHDWLKGLSLDTDRQLPAFCSRLVQATRNGSDLRKLLTSPAIVATIDHLMPAASPTRGAHLGAMMRVMTADLVIDEIDQFSPEDISAICRLVYLSGSFGRRVVVMSATMPKDVARALFAAYRAGWRSYAALFGAPDRVNALCTGDAPGSCCAQSDCESIDNVFDSARDAVVDRLRRQPVRRVPEFLPEVSSWSDLVNQVDETCSRLHDRHAARIDDFEVSFGFVKITRISHAAALFAQLPAGRIGDRLRLKICLHSQFPVLHRSWIENELRLALTRKNDDTRGMADFCRKHRVFERARAAGVTKIEIVLVCSPVIETGNDLDFDYAILDALDIRTIVQPAGRVNRHRDRPVFEPNVALFALPLVTMQSGRLENPGIETRTHRDTLIETARLDKHASRRTLVELLGRTSLPAIDARLVLDDAFECVSRSFDERMRGEFMGGHANVELFSDSPFRRLVKRYAVMRRFRRQSGVEVEFFLAGGTVDDLTWFYERKGSSRSLLPPTRAERSKTNSDRDRPVSRLSKCIQGVLFEDIEVSSWAEYWGHDDTPTEREQRAALRVMIPVYGDADIPEILYSPDIGLVRGTETDLFSAFCKSPS